MNDKICLVVLAMRLTSLFAQGVAPYPPEGMTMYPEDQERLPRDYSLTLPKNRQDFQNYNSFPIYQLKHVFPQLPAHPNPPVPHIQPTPYFPDPLPSADSLSRSPLTPSMPLIVIPIYSQVPGNGQGYANSFSSMGVPWDEGKNRRRHRRHKAGKLHRKIRHHKDDFVKDTINNDARISLMPPAQDLEDLKTIYIDEDEKFTGSNWIPNELQFEERKPKFQMPESLRLAKVQYVDGDGEIIYQKNITNEEAQQLSDLKNKRFVEEVKKEIESMYGSVEVTSSERNKNWSVTEKFMRQNLDEEQKLVQKGRRFYKNGNLVFQ